MATLAEEIQIRIDLYGGREAVIRAIENEWKPVPDFMFKERRGSGGNSAHPLWTKGERDILTKGLEQIAIQINKSREAIRAKLYFEGML